LASSHSIACISHFLKENMYLIVGKSELKLQGKKFGGTPGRNSRHPG